MTIQEIVANIDDQNEEAIIFAKRINEKFLPHSETIVLELDEEELASPIREIANQRCPGFDYFLEVFLVKEILEDLNSSVGFKALEQKVDRVIHYAELDA